MKTTVEIEPQLLRAAKRAAIDRHSTLKALIEGGLRRELAARPARLDWTKFPVASGPWPEGLDISSREKMWEWIASGTTGSGEAAWRRPEQSGRPLPPNEARPQPDHREGVQRRAAVPPPPAPARGKSARHGRD